MERSLIFLGKVVSVLEDLGKPLALGVGVIVEVEEQDQEDQPI